MKAVSLYAWLAAGILLAALGVKGFLIPAHFIDGGVTGVSMLLAKSTGIPLGVVLVVVNLPFAALAYQAIGPAFAAKTTGAILLLALAIAFVPYPPVTEDKLLSAVFGGIFIGAGVGLAIRGGGVLDGTEILAVILSRRTFATVGEVILALNVVIFALAALTLGIEGALYSALTYLSATKTIDYLLHGIEAYNGVLIVSPQHRPIRESILSELGRGVTAFHATGGYTSAEQQVLFCVVTRLELTRLEAIVHAHDPSAFVVVLHVHEASGGVIKKRGLH